MSQGLDGVSVCDTILSEVDGERGRLLIRGVPLEELVASSNFEEAVGHLWRDLVDEAPSVPHLVTALGRARCQAFETLRDDYPRLSRLPVMDGLRTAISMLDARSSGPLEVCAAVPVTVAALARQQQGLSRVEPDERRGHAADFLRMVRARDASPAEAAALDAYLVTVMEHGMNASTFTARVIASTRSTLVASVCGALGALQGPLHGGAPGPVLDMLDDIASIERADAWIESHLQAGDRLMGFGHRIYHVRDPRADVLAGVVARLQENGVSGRLAFARQVEDKIVSALERHKPGRHLQTNVEYYTALTHEALGLARHLFTPVFAIGRIAGWIAHVYEQRREGRLMRPQSRYVGPLSAGRV